MSTKSHVWFVHRLVFAFFNHSFRTHSRSKIGKELKRVGDPGKTLVQENLPPIGSVGHSVSTSEAELLLSIQGATVESQLLPVGTSRSKTEEIKCLTLICRVRSFQAKGTLNYKQPHSKEKHVKHLLPGTPHSAPGLPGFSRPINWHC